MSMNEVYYILSSALFSVSYMHTRRLAIAIRTHDSIRSNSDCMSMDYVAAQFLN